MSGGVDRDEAEDDFFDAIDSLDEAPLEALFRAIACIQRERARGESLLEELERNLLVRQLTLGERFLDLAEAIAAELVRAQPNATNLSLMATVLEKRGRFVEAAEARARATSAPERKYDVRYDEFIKRQLEKHR